MNYILLARGASLETARVLAVSADQDLVGRFAAELADDDEHEEAGRSADPVPLHAVPGNGE